MKPGLERKCAAVDGAPGSAGGAAAEPPSLASSDYDLVVLDLALPKVDGHAVLRRLRDRRSQAPVLILTARDALEDRVASTSAPTTT